MNQKGVSKKITPILTAVNASQIILYMLIAIINKVRKETVIKDEK